MISIHECNTKIAAIARQHTIFVSARVKSSISFYLEVFKYLRVINGKRITDSAVNSQINKIQTKVGCKHYKSLLNHILKADKTVKSETHAYLIKRPENRKAFTKNFSQIIAALTQLERRYNFLLNVDFCANPDRYYPAYVKIKSECAPAKDLFEKIFDYDWFTRLAANHTDGPYELTRKIGLNSCPYCNRQYTFTVTVLGGKKVVRPELDHFLPKSENRLLALSFFNLIPSCSVCNSSVKGFINTSYHTHLSPYAINEKHGLMRFTYIPLSYTASIGVSEDVQINLDYSGDPTLIELKKKVEGNIKLFYLKELYSNHTDTVKEIIFKRKQTNDKYLEMTRKTFKKLNLSQEDAYRLAFGNYFLENDFHKRPLAKLTKDIAFELGILPDFP